MSKRDAKYSWVWTLHDQWLKDQAENIRKKGINIDTVEVSRLLQEKVIVPNNINLVEIFQMNPIKLKRKRR